MGSTISWDTQGQKHSVAAGSVFIPISYSVKAVLEGGASVTKQKRYAGGKRGT